MKTSTLIGDDYIEHDPFSFVLEGEGGGGKGKQPKIEDDTFRTGSVAKVILAYGIGQCGGLKRGAKSIFFDRTPLEDESGNRNFSGVSYVERFGTQGQSAVKGFEAATNVIAISTQLTKSGGAITRTVQSASVDSLRIIMSIPNLSHTEKDGDIRGTDVQFKFEVRDAGAGVWEDRGTKTVNGKASYPFELSYAVDGPSTITGPWQYRVTRITDDSDNPRKQNMTHVARTVEIEETKQTYPGVAYVAITIDTELFANGIPLITLEVEGILVDVPSNYDEEWGSSKVPRYTGTWNGTFKKAATNNPAWHLYHLIKNEKYGAGIKAAYLDKYAFYEMAQYCDAVNPATGVYAGVADGDGGKKTRYEFVTQLTQAEDALKMLQNIAAAARAIIYYGAGAILPSQDRPKSVAAIIGNENVLEGKFIYSSSEAASRVTICNCTYNDYTNFGEPAVATYPNIDTWGSDPGILRYGKNEIDIAKLGCTNEAEAYAFAKWYVWTSINEGKTLAFTAGPEHGNSLKPGDIIEVYDRRLAKERWSGRLAAGSTATSIKLDGDGVTLASGKTYQIKLVSNDGKTVVTRNITSPAGTRKTIACASFGFTPKAGYTWAIKGPDIQPTVWQILSVEKQSLLEYAVFAKQHYPEKFEVVEQGRAFRPGPVIRRNYVECKMPTNMVFKLHGQVDPASGVRNNLTVGWTKSSSEGVRKYIVRYRREKRDWSEPQTTNKTSFEISGIRAGTYDVVVYAENINGVKSPGLEGSYTVTYGSPSNLPTLQPPILQPAP